MIIASMILIPLILGTAALFIAQAWTREPIDDVRRCEASLFIVLIVAGNVIVSRCQRQSAWSAKADLAF